MKLKLDENLGSRFIEPLAAAGHDVSTVLAQKITSASDETLATVCGIEERCLVTLDLDFANPLRFDPTRHAGIVVLRVGNPITTSKLAEAVATLIEALQTHDVRKRLWVIQAGRLREYRAREPND
jgi:predicted nuclease of predicted toxin-antitoxin system